MRYAARAVLGFLATALALTPAWATTAVERTETDLIQEAAIIVTGHCTRLESQWLDRDLVTVATISVSEVLKGAAGPEVTVVLPGGIDTHRRIPIAMSFPAAPEISQQENVLLFLMPEDRVAGGSGFPPHRHREPLSVAALDLRAAGDGFVHRDIDQMQRAALVADAAHVMDDQQRAGIKIYYAFREELIRSPAFQRLEEDFKKHGAAQDLNAAMFDGEILIFSQSYGQVPLGMVGKPTPITMINELMITWKPELIRDLNPAPLFDMTRYVFEYDGAKSFKAQVARVKGATFGRVS